MHALAPPGPTPYAPRAPERTLLHRVVREELETFLERAEVDGEGVPGHVERELRAYLRCGIHCHGFARARCEACGRGFLVGLSCKGRGICPSCTGRRMSDGAAHLVDRVFPRVPVRQWVLTVPKRVRFFLARDAEVASGVQGVFVRAVFARLRRDARRRGVRGGRPGAVTATQRFGASLRSHVHYHSLVLDGVYAPGPDESDDGAPVFHVADPPTEADLAAVASRIRRRVLALLEERGLFGDCDAAGMAEWVHSGFSLHAGVVVGAEDRKGLERLARYILRPPFAKGRLEETRDGRILYSYRRPDTGTPAAIVLTPQELLARLADLVPPPRAHSLVYRGVLAPNASLRALVVPRPEREGSCGHRRRRAEDDEADPPPPPALRARRLAWAELLARVWGPDALRCRHCGGDVRLVAFITHPLSVRAVLEGAGLPTEPLPLAPARGPPQTAWDFDQTAGVPDDWA